jgi:predicted PurR-regulated permease PerM
MDPPAAFPSATTKPAPSPSSAIPVAAAAAAVHASPAPPAASRLSAAAPELTRSVLAIIALISLIAGSLWVLRPFIPALIWATTIVIATWPLMTRMQTLLWGRRWLAVTVMTLALLLLFFVPLSIAIATVVDNADTVVEWFKAVSTMRFYEPPAWLAAVPLVGARAADYWREIAASGVGPLVSKVTPYVGTVATRVVREAGAIGAVGIEFLLTVAVSAVLYGYGEQAAAAMLRFAHRLAGERGVTTAQLAAASIRGVALGVVVTAVVQSVLGGIGLAVAGIPAATLLTALMFLLTIAQLGPFLVLLPAAGWLFWSGDTGWAIALVAWTVFVGTMDNFLRPWLINKGANLPLLLIFAGVVGGLIAFGLLGIFIGPVVLAVTYTLMGAWMAERPADAAGAHDG